MAMAALPLTDDKSDLDSYVAKAVLGSALPVSAVESPAFVKLLKRLAPPGYEPPSAFALATAALDLEYTEVQLKLRAEVLDAASVCLGVETWAATLQRPIVSCVINTPTCSGVFALESTGEVPHTPEVLVEKVESVMTQIGTGKVAVIVTDNTTSPAMKQAALALQAKYPAITFLSSCAHAMAAMVADLLALPPVATTLAVGTELARFLSEHHVARAALARIAEQMQGLEPSASLGVDLSVADLASNTQSHPAAALERLMGLHHHRHSLDILLAENGALSGLAARVKDQLLSLAFWEDVATFAALFEPFLELLKTFDADCPLLSTFYHRFTLLWGHVDKFAGSAALATECHQVMSAAWQSVQHPAMYTAYVLDPRFPPSSLSPEATNEVFAYLKRAVDASAYAAIVSELTRFTSRSGLFADDAIWEAAQKCSPVHWWKGFIGSACPNLQAVALRTLSFPASSGLARGRRDMFDRIQSMNSKYMNDDQASKAALVYLNTTLAVSAAAATAADDGVANNETIV